MKPVFIDYRWAEEDFFLTSQGRNGLAKTNGVTLSVDNASGKDGPPVVRLTPITSRGEPQNAHVAILAEEFTKICKDWLRIVNGGEA